MDLFVFPTPANAKCTLTHDTGQVFQSVAKNHPSGRAGQAFEIPDTVPDGNGGTLDIVAEGYVPIKQRGVLFTNLSIMKPLAMWAADDFHLPTGAGRFL